MPDFKDYTLDEDDRGSASSDNEQDELMEDAEDLEQDADQDGEGDGDDDDNEEDEDQDGEDDEEESPEKPVLQIRRPSLPSTNSSSNVTPTISQVNGVGPTSHPHPTLNKTSASPREASAAINSPKVRFEVRPEALNASLYDIAPTMAAPQSTSINAVAATPDMRWWYTGGSDGYIRKYDGVATVNGKTMLTVAQRHPFVESVVKAGVLVSYWDNEEPVAKNPGEDPPLSPVYSLAVQSQALWILSGLESGCINLYSVRHDEGKRVAYMHKHKSAVSVLTLSQDEKSVLSGSWDKNVFDWDLNTGQIKRTFEGSGGQTSAIEIRPASSLPVPQESEEVITNGTFSSNNGRPLTNGALTNGTNGTAGEANNEGSPTDSLFGGGSDTNSLFGETTAENAPSGGVFGDEDDEFSRAIESSLDNQGRRDSQGDLTMTDAAPAPAVQPPQSQSTVNNSQTNGNPNGDRNTHETESTNTIVAETQDAVATSDSTFLAASIDGSLRIWDRRMPNPVARIPVKTGVPPWCMAACWSPDGNYIYAGRRNNTVEEFSLHKGLKTAERTFKFPAGSGAVTALRPMPNGRHLICASNDILRLYDLRESAAFKHSTVPFLIVPGPPKPGVISALHIDPTCKYMLSAAGNRGWEGINTEVLIGYEIGCTP